MNWQPIETAPKDGTRVLCSDGADVAFCCFTEIYDYNKKEYITCWAADNYGYDGDSGPIDAILWMPIKELPQSETT